MNKYLQYLLFVVIAGISNNSFATDYYIRTDGNDNNTGKSNTSNGAWKSIANKVGSLNPGDVLWIADGTYIENEIKLINKTGSDANRIVIRAINSKAAKISSTSAYNAINITNCIGVTVQDLEVFFPSGSTNIYFGILTEECDYVTIKNNTVYNAGCSGIQPNLSDNILVEGNTVYNCATRNSVNGSGISVYHPKVKSSSLSGFGIIVRNNISYNNNCTVPDKYGNITDGNGIIIDDFKNEQGGGQDGGYSKGALVENNICYNNGGRGIHVFSSDNVTVRNNTVWHNSYTLNARNVYSGDLSMDGGVNCKFVNNISVVNPAYTKYGCALKVNTDMGTTKLNNNMAIGPDGIQFQTYMSTTTLTGNGNSGNILNAIDTYPKFVNPNVNSSIADFHLQSSSPAINKGININASTNDKDGIARPQGGTVDIGSYEFGSKTFAIPSTIEAEVAELSNATVANNHTGFSGTGFVDGYETPGSRTLFRVNAVAAGNFNFKLFYANAGSNSSLSIYVNNTKLKQSTLPVVSSSWNDWNSVNEVIALKAGANTVEYVYDVTDGGKVNLDKIEVTNNVTTGFETESNVSKITAFPNPFSTVVYISEKQNWKLYNNAGQLIMEGDSNMIDGALLDNGMYLLKLEDRNVYKLIK